MKKNFVFIFLSLTLGLASLAEASQTVRTQGHGDSPSVLLVSPVSILQQFQILAITRAKGESLGRANEICETQLKGHILLPSLQFSEPQCTADEGLLSTSFHCSIEATALCDFSVIH